MKQRFQADADFNERIAQLPGHTLALLSFSLQDTTMSFTGIVKDGVVLLPPEAHLPNGAEVEVVLHSEPDEDPFLAAIGKTARPRPYWPQDYALNHGHYVSGEPRKS